MAGPPMLVFPANNDGYRNRKRTYKACEQCKRRRRRCVLQSDPTKRCGPCEYADIECSLCPLLPTTPSDDPPSRSITKPGKISLPHPPSDLTADLFRSSAAPFPSPGPAAVPNRETLALVTGGTEKSTLNSKFIGNTDPTSLFARLSPASRSVNRPQNLRPTPQEQETPSPLIITTPDVKKRKLNSKTKYITSTNVDPTDQEAESKTIGVWVHAAAEQRTAPAAPALNPFLAQYLQSIDAFTMPVRRIREGLIDIYFRRVNRLFPLLNERHFRTQHHTGKCPTVLLHSVLLVAARDQSARPFLAEDPGFTSVRQYCEDISRKIKALLFAEVESDRLTLLRTNALLSIHSEGPNGLEAACEFLGKAIHYAISLGVHHKRPFLDKDELKQLWWALFCMDRINSIVNARPLFINKKDISIDFPNPATPSLATHLVHICVRLEKVISLYQPHGDRRVVPKDIDKEDFGDSGEALTDPSVAILALLFHCTSILAHKRTFVKGSSSASASSSASGSSEPIGAEVRAKKAKTNELLLRSTYKILAILDLHGVSELPPLPLVPYCISLTLTVFLRTFPSIAVDPAYLARLQRPAADRGAPYKPHPGTRVYYTWQDSCKMLQKFTDVWWVSKTMGIMGESIFTSLHREHQAEFDELLRGFELLDVGGMAKVAGNDSEKPVETVENSEKSGKVDQSDKTEKSGNPEKSGKLGNVETDLTEPGKAASEPSNTPPADDYFSRPARPWAPSSVPAFLEGTSHLTNSYYDVTPAAEAGGTVKSGNGSSQTDIVEEYLMMFSELPNTTSFFDEMLNHPLGDEYASDLFSG